MSRDSEEVVEAFVPVTPDDHHIVRLEAETATLREQLAALERRRSDEQASYQRTFDKMIGEELRLKAALAERPATPDARVATALRQLATHVLTFLALYDPKAIEGDGESARRLREVRERARAALEHVPAEAVPANLSKSALPAPSAGQQAVLDRAKEKK